MDIGIILKAAGGVLALAVALAILGPWIWKAILKIRPSAATSAGGNLVQQVTSKAAIALVWSAVQTIVGTSYAQGDKETANAALALLPQVHTWDDVPTVADPAAGDATTQASTASIDLAALQSQVAAIAAKVGV